MVRGSLNSGVFGSAGTRPPIVGTGEHMKEEKRGLSPRSPLDILLQPYSQTGGFDESYAGSGLRLLQAGVEGVAEGIDYTIDSTAAHIPEGEKKVSEQRFKGRGGEERGAGIDLDETWSNIKGFFGEGGVEEGDEPLHPKIDPEVKLGELQEAQGEVELYDKMLSDPSFTDEDKFVINQARENAAERMDEIALELEQAKQELGAEDAFFDFQADQLGLGDDIDLAPLEETLSKEGGVGLETLQHIRDIANDATMSMADKSEAIDFITARADVATEMQKGIEDLVKNRDDLIEFERMSDTELAGQLGIESFFDPQFPEVIETDPEVRYGMQFSSVIDQSEMGDALANAAATDPSIVEPGGVWDQAIQAVRQFGPRSEQGRAAIAALARKTNTNAEDWVGVLDQAKARADHGAKQAEAAIDADQLNPYSEALTIALGNAGQELIGAGENPEAVKLIANYPGLHAIIKAKTEGTGRAGFKGKGTIRGMGGLSEDLYPILMQEEGDDGEWNEDRGMEWELKALLRYIMRQFDGDPVRAIDHFRKTGQWGGVGSIGGDS